MIISKIKIEHSDSSGGNVALTATMPKEIANWIMAQVIDWEEKWAASFSTHQQFVKERDKFNENKTP